METNTAAVTDFLARTAGVVIRTLTYALCVAVVVVFLAFGAPSQNSNGAEGFDFDAHSDGSYELSTSVAQGR